jgi:hypothetical protein
MVYHNLCNTYSIEIDGWEYLHDLQYVFDYPDNAIAINYYVYSTNKSLTMLRVCNFLPLPRVILRCPELANSYLEGSNDVILSIPNNAKSNGQIVYNTLGSIKNIFRLDFLNSFVVSLTDDNGNLINFNGVSSFFTFQFDIHRKQLKASLLEQQKFRIKVNQFIFARQRVAISRPL